MRFKNNLKVNLNLYSVQVIKKEYLLNILREEICMKIGRIYSAIVIGVMGLMFSVTASATSILNIEKVQNIPYGKTVKINVDFQTVKK